MAGKPSASQSRSGSFSDSVLPKAFLRPPSCRRPSCQWPSLVMRGARFLVLPQAVTIRRGMNATTQDVTPPKWRILLVDDEPTQRLIMARLLKRAGYEVESAANGREALARIAAGDFQLMITDWEMPEMDGIALCRALRSSQEQGLHLYDSADGARRDRACRHGAAGRRRRLPHQARHRAGVDGAPEHWPANRDARALPAGGERRESSAVRHRSAHRCAQSSLPDGANSARDRAGRALRTRTWLPSCATSITSRRSTTRTGTSSAMQS